jgi:hypothetical protein
MTHKLDFNFDPVDDDPGFYRCTACGGALEEEEPWCIWSSDGSMTILCDKCAANTVPPLQKKGE